MGATAHLGIKFGEYDTTIASLIPHYKELIDAAAAAVDAVAPTAPAVVDLGTGSGALAAAILQGAAEGAADRHRRRRGDAGGGDAAAARQHRHHRGQLRARAASRAATWSRPRSRCITSIPAARRRRSTSDASPRCATAACWSAPIASWPRAASCSKRHREAWLEHLQKKYTRKKAENFLRTWAKEDVYFTLDREIELLRDAGFSVEVTWRKDSFAVVVGLK